MLAVDEFKLESIPVLEIALGPVLEKAISTPVPQTNVSDEDRGTLSANSFLVKLIFSCLDLFGPHFVYNATFAPMLDPLLKWLFQ